jgi:hypothetical protein
VGWSAILRIISTQKGQRRRTIRRRLETDCTGRSMGQEQGSWRKEGQTKRVHNTVRARHSWFFQFSAAPPRHRGIYFNCLFWVLFVPAPDWCAFGQSARISSVPVSRNFSVHFINRPVVFHLRPSASARFASFALLPSTFSRTLVLSVDPVYLFYLILLSDSVTDRLS